MIPSPVTNVAGAYHHPNVYGGLVSGWDPGGAWINTYGWVPLGGAYVSNAAPGTTYDTWFSQFSDATLFVGAPMSVFEHNWVCNVNPQTLREARPTFPCKALACSENGMCS